MGISFPPSLTGAPGTHVCLPDGTHVTALFNLPAILICLALTWLLVIGIRESARVNTTIVIIKLAVLILFVAIGVQYINPANLHPFIPPNTGTFGSFGWSGILRGAGVIFFAYIGFDAVSTASQEARNPGRDIPIGILVSLAICTVIYIAVGLVMTGLVPYPKLGVPSPIALAVQATGLKWLAPIINIGAICGISSVILVNMLAQSRIFYSMSRDGLLPPLFAKLHPRYRTPHVTTAITGCVVAIASGLFPIGVLGQLVSMGTLLAFAIVCTGVLILRKISPETPRPFRTPGMPWVPVVGTLICLYLMSGLPLPTWIRLFVWLAIGLTCDVSRLHFLRRGEHAMHRFRRPSTFHHHHWQCTRASYPHVIIRRNLIWIPESAEVWIGGKTKEIDERKISQVLIDSYERRLLAEFPPRGLDLHTDVEWQSSS